VLAHHPDGLTNTEVGHLTGLNPDVKRQKGYVTWTILQRLVDERRVLRKGKRYLLDNSGKR
jgi:hypothetical protein